MTPTKPRRTIPEIEIEKKTYIMVLPTGRLRRVTIPFDWKVTFGPLVPPAQREHHVNKTFALRFYENKDQQRAVFTDVVAFYEVGMDVQEDASVEFLKKIKEV